VTLSAVSQMSCHILWCVVVVCGVVTEAELMSLVQQRDVTDVSFDSLQESGLWVSAVVVTIASCYSNCTDISHLR